MPSKRWYLILLTATWPAWSALAGPPVELIEDHPLFRDGTCQVVDAETQTLARPPASSGTTPHQVTKVHTLCIGTDIVVKDNLYTNGGSLAILADTLTLNASLDTRIWFEMVAGDRKSVPTKWGVDYFEDRTYDGNVPVDRWKYGRPDFLWGVIQNYYTECHECREDTLSLRSPEYPAGLVPSSSYSGCGTGRRYPSGLSPLPFDNEGVRSGDVSIFVRDLTIAKALLSGQRPPIGLCAPQDYEIRPFAINASGVTGGRGGLGSPSPASGFMPGGMFSCGDPLYLERGNGGPGGPGGPGGIVRIQRVGMEADAEFRALVTAATSVAGGHPGARGRKIPLPVRSGPDRGKVPTVPACQLDETVGLEQAGAGEDGILQISETNSTETLLSLIDLAERWEAVHSVAFPQFARRAEISENVFTSSPLRFVEHKMTELTLGSQASIALAVEARVRGMDREAGSLPHLVRGFDLDQALAATGEPRLRQVLLHLKEVDLSDGQSPLVEYLIRIGGVLNRPDPNAHQRMRDELLRLDLGTNIVLNAEILKELGSLSHVQYELLAETRGEKLKQAATKLEEQIESVRQEIEQLQQGGGLLDLLQEVASVIPVVREFVEVIDEIVMKPKMVLEKADASSKAVAGLFHDTSAEVLGKIEEMQKLQLRLEELNEAIEMFEAEVKASRVEALRKSTAYDRSGLSAREALVAKLDSRPALFVGLLKLSLASFLVDVAQNERELVSNAVGLHSLVASFPGVEPVLTFYNIDRQPKLYHKLAASESWRLAWVPTALASLDRIPAYVIPPDRTVNLDTFGLTLEVIHLPRFTARQGPLESFSTITDDSMPDN